MKKSFALPFTLDVEMKVYQNKAFPLGAIKANLLDYKIWLCNKLINCVWLKQGELDSIGLDLWHSSDDLSTHQHICLESENLSYKSLDIIEFNKKMLLNGNYITGFYNEYYIPSKEGYQSHYFYHDYIIFGYDDSKKVFKSASYLSDSSYSFFDIAYEDYRCSLISIVGGMVQIDYYKINHKYKAKLKMKHIKKNLIKYCTHCEEKLTGMHNVFGIDAWIKLARYVETCETKLDVRFARLYMEHHYLMLQRMEILYDVNEFKDYQLLQDYRCIYEKTMAIYYLFIKYNLNGNIKTLGKIVDRIMAIVPTERVLIEKLINYIN